MAGRLDRPEDRLLSLFGERLAGSLRPRRRGRHDAYSAAPVGNGEAAAGEARPAEPLPTLPMPCNESEEPKSGRRCALGERLYLSARPTALTGLGDLLKLPEGEECDGELAPLRVIWTVAAPSASLPFLRIFVGAETL